MEAARPPRIALACPGVGLVQRGYERMFQDLFELLSGSVDITLFKGGGATNDREKVPAFFARNGRFVRMLPLHKLIGRSSIHVECMTYALGLMPHLRAGAFDVVHVIDPPLARMLYKLRRLSNMRFRLLFTHGCSMPPSHYPPAEHVQEVAKVTYDDAVNAGIPAHALTLVPCGIHPARFEARKSREELRREYGIGASTFVILSVAALNRVHKRTHYLVDEAARMEGDFLLWLDGSIDQGDPGLIDYARSRLGARVRITHVPSANVADLYRLADVMAHASTFEAFGLSIVEAASAGLPVLVHDAPHFQWLVPNPRAWVDMAGPGALSARLREVMAHPHLLDAIRCRDLTRSRFDWQVLRREYESMYEAVHALSLAVPSGPTPNFFWQLHA